MDSPLDALGKSIDTLRADLLRCQNEIAVTADHLDTLQIHREELNTALDEWAAALTYLGGRATGRLPAQT